MKKIFLSVFLLPCAMVLAGCDDGGNDAESAKKISGAITYIDNYDYGCDLGGRTGILGIDDDDELDDDTPLKTWSLTWVSGSTFIYSVDISGLEDGVINAPNQVHVCFRQSAWKVLPRFHGNQALFSGGCSPHIF